MSRTTDAAMRYQCLANWPSHAFHRITRLTAELLSVPFAFISLVRSDDVWFQELPERSRPAVIKRDQFPETLINASSVVIVPDLERGATFSTGPLVINNISTRFYAGTPLITPEGNAFGVLGVIDSRLRSDWSEVHSTTLTCLAGIAVDELEVMRIAAKREQMGRPHITSADASGVRPRPTSAANFFRVLAGNSAR